MAKFVIAGYYGRDNLGDEAMLSVMAAGFQRLAPACEITVISADPARTIEMHGSGAAGEGAAGRGGWLRAVGRTDIVGLLRALFRCDLLVVGGGSLLQDVTSRRNLIYYLALCLAGRLFGKPVMLFANGIGPITGRLGRSLTRAVLSRVSLITVRDTESAAELTRLGVTRPKALVTADPVLGLPDVMGCRSEAGGEDAVSEALGLAGRDRPLIGVSLRPWKGTDELQEALISACREFLARNGGRVVILPMQWPADAEAAGRLRAALGSSAMVPSGPLRVGEMLKLISSLDLVVAVRFHALVMAALGGVPVVGLTYDPKVDNFLNSIGLRSAGSVGMGSVGRADSKAIFREMQAAYEARGTFYDGVKADLDRQRAAARENLRLAAGLLPDPGPRSENAAEPAPSRATVLGVEVDRITLNRAKQIVENFIEQRRRDGKAGEGTRVVVTPNAEMIYQSQYDPELHRVLRRADLAVPDGSGVVWAARRVGRPVPERVPGVDLASALLERAAAKEYRLYLFGGQPGVAARAAEQMCRAHPGLRVVGCRHGFFGPEENSAIVEDIRRARPDLVFVCLGSPKQEKWIGCYGDSLGAGAVIGLGGFLDVWSGMARRAPLWIRNLGLEWLYRLCREPWRYRRMMVLPKFALAVALWGSRPLRKGV